MVREDDLNDGESDDGEASSPPRRARPGPRRPPPRPVKRWKGRDEEEEDEGDDADEHPSRRRRWPSREQHPVYWRARDSLYFEPLVAVAIIVLLLVGLYAYTQNWPPVYVVESSSMQHGDTDIVGLINTGDLVLAQKIPSSTITTYLQGLRTGYSTYGEYGDVVLYYGNGMAGTPIIHRAILYLEWDALPGAGGYNVTQLLGLPCGDAAGAMFNVTPSGSTTPAACTTTADLTDLKGTLTLYHIGWRDAFVTVPLDSSLLGAHDGFLTMGDNNLVSDDCTPGVTCQGEPDQLVPGRSTLVEPGWIVGVARGMLPWFGALKLLLEGNAQDVPPQSWQFLGITIAGLILLAFGIHYAFRAEGAQDPRRRSDDDEEDEDDDERTPGWARRFLQGIRPWHRDEDEDEEEPDLPKRRPPKHAPPRSSSPGRRGRPPPRVRRAKKPKHRSDDSDDDD